MKSGEGKWWSVIVVWEFAVVTHQRLAVVILGSGLALTLPLTLMNERGEYLFNTGFFKVVSQRKKCAEPAWCSVEQHASPFNTRSSLQQLLSFLVETKPHVGPFVPLRQHLTRCMFDCTQVCHLSVWRFMLQTLHPEGHPVKTEHPQRYSKLRGQINHQ